MEAGGLVVLKRSAALWKNSIVNSTENVVCTLRENTLCIVVEMRDASLEAYVITPHGAGFVGRYAFYNWFNCY